MNWLAQNWLWIVLGVVVLAVLNRGTRYRRQSLGHPCNDIPEVPEPADRAVDPVTNKTISTAGAVTSLYQGRVYYFESAENRQRFEASPGHYVREAPARRTAGHDARGHRHGRGCC